MTESGFGRRRGLLIGVLFFISGFTGLIYEVVWAKYLALLLGSTAYAQVGVLAVFMGGLALGSVVWGEVVDRSARPLAVYGVLEIGIGVCAAGFALGFDWLSQVYWSGLAAVGNTGSVAVLLKVGLCIVAMLPPTFCMGGTLPVLSRALNVERRALGRGVAFLYAINSFGAMLGAVLTGFYLVAMWGFDAPFLGAAVVNGAVGVIALLCASRWSAAPLDRGAPAYGDAGGPAVAAASLAELTVIRGYVPLVLAGAAISGAVAMVYEVAWIRLCSLVLGSSTYSFSIMLAAFISGIAAGSVAYTLLHPSQRRPLRFFAYTSIVAAMVLLLCLPWYDRLPYYAGKLAALMRARDASFAAYQAASLVFCMVVMLPLTFISGLNFPALAHAAAQARAGVGRPVSHVLFANTAGTIVGTVLGGLYLLPAIGLRHTFLLGLSATLAVALTVLIADRALPRRRLAAIGGVCVGGMLYIVVMPAWDLRLLVAGEFRRHEGIDAASFTEYRAGLEQELLYYADGTSATVSVERQPPDEIALRVNGKADASALGDADTELLSGHLPTVVHAHARRVLVIGYGSGLTVGALLQHPIESVDVVEISPEVIAAGAYFRPYNHDALNDPRTHLYIEDARTFLYRVSGQYDLIISEPSNPWIAGISNLFTQEFFDQARSRLAPDGLLLQWFHTYETTDGLVALILRTVAQGFGEVRVFQPNRWDVFLVASPAPRPVDRAAMAAAFADAGELQKIGVNRLATLLALEVLPDSLVRRVAGAGAINRDRMPLLEYAAPRAFFDGRSANLLASTNTLDAVGFVGATETLGLDDYRDMGEYLQRANMGQYLHMLRVLPGWLSFAPADRDAQRALNVWMSGHSNAPELLHAMVGVSPVEEPERRDEYMRLVVRIAASVHLTPHVSDIAIVAPAVRAAAERSTHGAELLRELGDLYVAAGAPAEAMVDFDAALARADGATRTTVQCRRGLALEKSGNAAAARDALQQCLQGNPTNASALAALQRLGGDSGSQR